MSHIITAELEITKENLPLLEKAVETVGGEWLGKGTSTLYRESVSGYRFTLPDWRYPGVVVFNGNSGSLKYDNYNGLWGKQEHMDSVVQTFVKNVVTAAAKRHGYRETATRMNAEGQMEVTLVCR